MPAGLPSLPPLPVDAVVPAIRGAVRAAGAVVLKAPTGAGKTTRVPPALLDDRLTLMLEPRRMAARAAARRMAAESGTALGETFGYHVRFERQASSRTRCLVVTPGILLRMLHDDPELSRVGTVVFDEFHERGIDADLALGRCQLLRDSLRPDLRMVVMSATVDPQPIAKFLNDAPVVVSEGRSFPVEIRYRPKRPEQSWPEAVAAAIRGALADEPGDVLAFLPGLGEIRRTAERLDSLDDVDVLPLHGELPPEQQDRALRRGDRRRVVLATNVAETSVTVDGVRVVVDSGLARELSFEPAFGMDKLALRPISRASADQRAGRAGRTQPGVCIRIWSEIDHRGRPEQSSPEIQRVDLAGPTLQVRAWGDRDLMAVPWLEPPPTAACERANDLLARLGFTDDGGLTADGEVAARWPVHPRLARMLIDGRRAGVARAVAMAAAVLSDRDPCEIDRPDPTDSDLLDRVHALVAFQRTGRTDGHGMALHRHGARFTLDLADQLARTIADDGDGPADRDDDDAVLRAVAAAYADRLCRRRGPNDRRAVMRGGRGVRLGPESGVNEAELFVAIDVDARGPDALVRMASAVRREWLDPDRLTTSAELLFDDATGRIVARKRTRFGDLLIDDVPGHVADDDAADRIMAEAALARLVEPADDAPVRGTWNRLAWLRGERPELDLPPLTWSDLLPDVCRGRRSIAAVKSGPWSEALRSRFTYAQWQTLESMAPAEMTVPTGRAIPLAYAPGQPPVLAVKIQELFGLPSTPCIAGGTVPVLLHLLAPNGRPQQTTRDLASFWANGYSIVRKELRGRYPKHPWPDDPTTAEPTRGVKRRPQ